MMDWEHWLLRDIRLRGSIRKHNHFRAREATSRCILEGYGCLFHMWQDGPLCNRIPEEASVVPATARVSIT